MSKSTSKSNCGIVPSTDISCNALSCGYGVSLPSSQVTQATSVTTAVTANNLSGIITCFTSTLAAQTAESFVVNCSNVVAGDRILVSIINYTGDYGTNGLPCVAVNGVGSGTFTIAKYNADTDTALSGVVQISYLIIKS